ncbi:Sec-independent protein translocase subunit TatA [Streptomyces sp. P01-B04]|uniref:Sec-independent protein translocase subunit TatA n=1 Tax=Streptomyces poriferorum TaxID=2798799 RepID=UPI001C5D504D|nr:Sec-independent protein translocase subunit TatA [Streptomyces poriferorum]MBW5252117.1 Sec-independent protein translocase subunit TatA [Streptomyces poriferorum]MBW5260275.1 Sec-independent protein translocase subunit TatA [Streptomyces poriferorum]
MFRNAIEPWHLLVLGLVIILLFGSKKLPDTARSLGKSLRILKSETKAMKEEGAQPTAPAGSGAAEQTTPKAVQGFPDQPVTAHTATESGTAR